MKLYDVSRPLTPALAGWPGDTRYASEPVLAIARGASVNVSAIRLSTHLGTHVDAPRHVLDGGARVHELPLDAYLGPALLVDVSHVRDALRPAHLTGAALGGVERLLVRTACSALPDDAWPAEIAFPAPETAEWLAARGVRLFGTDAPSVDPLNSKTLDGHRALLRGGIAILEGLQLRGVPPGVYELIALPLKLDGDGAPVRAVLRG